MRPRNQIEYDLQKAVEQPDFQVTNEVLTVLKVELLMDIRDLLQTIAIKDQL